MSIEVKNITKTFGGFTALKDVSVNIPTGELIALLGPSGCGKTSLLRIIAGLETPDGGSVHFNGADTTRHEVRERKVGFVFQHYALFKHMTVFDNIAFGLQVRPRKTRPAKEEIAAKVHELIRLVQLEGMAQRYPSQLSGGQRQRVALARALAVEPQVLLLDEPFGALDARVRQELRRWLRRLHDELHITSVFVTHDQEEALEVADRVVIMNAGQVEQAGTPEEVYDHPATPFVYNFLGNVNLFHGRVNQGQAKLGEMELSTPELAAVPDRPAVGYVRPHDLELERNYSNSSSVEASIRHIHAVGPVVRIELERGDTFEILEAELTKDVYQKLAPKVGEKVFVRPRKYRVFVDDYQI
ncbi:sulfate/molybdate ABC transporter ATP-binding protein [Geotalea toluenoxydans]